MNKENLKTIAAVVGAMVCFCLLIVRLRDLFGNGVLWLLLAGVLVLVVMGITAGIKRRRSFREKGYEVMVGTDHGFIYRERYEGGVRELRLPGGLIEVGHPVYSRLSWETWEKITPDWARRRQLEIEARIHENAFYRPSP